MYLPLQKVAVGMLFFSRNNYPKWIFPWKGLGENKIHPGNKKWHLMIVDIMHILTQNTGRQFTKQKLKKPILNRTL